MKNFKKFLTLVLAVMMVVSSVAFSTSAATTKFEDVDADNETLVKAVDLLSYMGVAKGTSETTFGADEAGGREDHRPTAGYRGRADGDIEVRNGSDGGD